MRVNLLPQEFQFQLLLRSRLRCWTILWTLCACIAMGMTAMSSWRLRQLNCQVAEIREQSQPIAAQKQQTTQLKNRWLQVQAQTVATEELELPDQTLVLFSVLARSAATNDGQIQILRLSMQTHPLQATLHAVAEDDQSVSQFLAKLRAYGVFTRVDLKSSGEWSGASKGSRQFHVELKREC